MQELYDLISGPLPLIRSRAGQIADCLLLLFKHSNLAETRPDLVLLYYAASCEELRQIEESRFVGGEFELPQSTRVLAPGRSRR